MSRGASCLSCCRAAALTSVLVIGFDSLVLAAGEEPRKSRGTASSASRARPDVAVTPDIRVVTAPNLASPGPRSDPDARVTLPAGQPPPEGVFHAGQSSHSGPEYVMGSDWSLFAGVTNTDARVPGMPRHWTGAGLGYRPSEKLNVDFGFVHPYTNDTRFIDPLTASSSLANGRSGGSQLFGLSGRYRFDLGGH